MIFNSLDFVIFFILLYSLYHVLSHRGQNLLLLGASYLFYSWWDWRFTLILFGTSCVDYYCAGRIGETDDEKIRKKFLILSVTTNLTILGFFKYFDFFADSAVGVLNAFGFSPDPVTLNIVLPIGVSFYTFQEISYIVDVYRGHLKPSRRLPEYLLFVSFFPQLVAGPIQRATHLLPQVQKARRPTNADFREGAWLVLVGFFKKVVIADNLAAIADTVFNDPGSYHGLGVLFGVYAFALQIYGDFSGYSDIARGVARLLGFDLLLNFRMPYFAQNPQEFWRRWHISLSTWLRDYLYISLGGNRKGPLGTYKNLFLTMLLGGLWHGAAWNFVFWGAYQGLLLIVHRLFAGKADNPQNTGRAWVRVLKICVMFQFVCFGWVLFRINTISDLPIIMGNLFTADFSHLPWLVDIVVIAWPLFLIDYAQEKSGDLSVVKRLPAFGRALTYAVLLVYIAVLGKVDGSEFIYFQF